MRLFVLAAGLADYQEFFLSKADMTMAETVQVNRMSRRYMSQRLLESSCCILHASLGVNSSRSHVDEWFWRAC